MTDDDDTLRDHAAKLLYGFRLATLDVEAKEVVDAIIAACRAALGPDAKADGAAEELSPEPCKSCGCRYGHMMRCPDAPPAPSYELRPPAKPEATQCPATTFDRATCETTRCRKPSGHDGRHDDGCLQWEDAKPEATGAPETVCVGREGIGRVVAMRWSPGEWPPYSQSVEYVRADLAEREAAELRRHGDKMKEQRDALLALVQCTRDLGVVVDHTGELLGYDDARKRAETFASERDELRRQVSKLAEWCDALPKLIAERDEARARVAELEGALRDIGNSWCAECDGYDHTHLPTCSCAKPAPAAPPITSAAVESATQAMRGSGVGGGRPAK